ncbi:MAG TPA: transposase [Candidatus Methylomirabilis sp.]|nr:transposase [Candidatus Methylomirabilis sp.]
MIGRFDDKMINWIGFIYLRSFSLYSTVEIVRSFYEKDYLTRDSVLAHLEQLIDRLPDMAGITKLFRPARSGYYAFDGLWFKFQGMNRVLLTCFDAASLDLVNYLIADDENHASYGRLIELINIAEPGILTGAKGFYADGELGLLKRLKDGYGNVPLQLCVFHKYTRSNQIIPFVYAKGTDKIIKDMLEKVLFAPTKNEAIASLADLKRYAREHQENQKLKKIIGVLKRNFRLLLTHFDNPEMSPYNNVLEGFNHIIKRKIRLMKGFKKELNMDRWLKFILLDYRFHKVHSSSFKDRNGKSPLELAEVDLPKYHNWINLVRKKTGK